MGWFRHRIGLGVGLSLIAMALQLALTLSHTHAGELDGHERPAAHAPLQEAGTPLAPDHHHGPGSLCPDCLLIAQAATGLTAAPPALPAEATAGVPLAVPGAPATTPARARAGFHPRAPPRT